MATLEKIGNVLLVYGNDVYGDGYRGKLRNFLYSQGTNSSPVRKGTHDFWITYPVPSLGIDQWAYEDLSITPRKMRGIIRMVMPNNANLATIRRHIHVILQEVGHHWLVPQTLKIKTNGTVRPLPKNDEMTRQINDEADFDGPLLLARGNIHWSAYFQADASPMDGQYYFDMGMEDGYKRWKWRLFPGPVITPPGLDRLQLMGAYNDLDLYIMGVKKAYEAYSQNNGRFYWLEPRLAASLPYHIGIFVAFSKYDFYYFGFYRNHWTLGVQRTAGQIKTVDIGTDYRPLAHDYNGVALRVVRRGNQYYFQARYDNPLAGCLAGVLKAFFPRTTRLRVPRLFEDLDSLPQPDENGTFDRFRTVAILQSHDRPEAVGLIVKKSDHPHLAEGAFFNLELLHNGKHTIFFTDDVPDPLPAGASPANIPPGEWRLHNPTGDAIIKSKGVRLHIIAPFSTVNKDGALEHYPPKHFDHSKDTDNAPKILTRAPDGDFAFGTSCKVHRTIFTPWAAGYAKNRILWGKEKSARVMDIVVPDEIINEKQPPPPANTYKIAFIMVAEKRSDITNEMIERVDMIRRYWDAAFEAVTIGRRHSNSVL